MNILVPLLGLLTPIAGYWLVYLTKEETKVGKKFLDTLSVILLFGCLVLQVIFLAQTMNIAFGAGAAFVLVAILCYHYASSKQYTILCLTGAVLVSSTAVEAFFITAVLAICFHLALPGILQAKNKRFSFVQAQAEYFKYYASSLILIAIVGVLMV